MGLIILVAQDHVIVNIFEKFLINCQHTMKIINVALFNTSSLARLSLRRVKYS